MTKKTTNIAKRRRLQDLYARGREVRFNADGVNEGEPDPTDVVIWVSPPSPIHKDMALREAQAARSRSLLGARDKEGEEYINSRAWAAELPDADLHMYINAMGEADRIREAQRRVLGKDEWKDFDSLRDAMRQWEEAGFPTGPEWDPLIKRDQEFGEQVAEEGDRIREADLEALKFIPRQELEQRAIEKRMDLLATHGFMRAFEQWMLYYACRDDENHDVLFFDHPDEIREHPDHVAEALTAMLAYFIADGDEAKN